MFKLADIESSETDFQYCQYVPFGAFESSAPKWTEPSKKRLFFRLRRGERFPENILLGPTHSTNLHKLSSDSVPPMFDLIFHRALEEGAISSTMACCALSCTFVGNAFSAFSAFGLLCSDSGEIGRAHV